MARPVNNRFSSVARWSLAVTDAEHLPGAVPVQQGTGLVAGATVLVMLRSFANGGASVTKVVAISNSVWLFRYSNGLNARRVLLVMVRI